MDSEFLQAEDILGPEGRIAARLKNYEHRMQQLEMADAVAVALADKRHLVCLLYTSPSPRDISGSRMPSSA